MEEWTYIYLDNFLYSSLYINLDQGLVSLMYFLYFYGKPFGFLERKTNRHFMNRFLPFVRLMRVLQFTYVFYRKKKIYKKSNSSFPILSSSHYGNCLILVGDGEHKIVNFKKKNVTTVFPHYFSTSEMNDRINKLRDAQSCHLSPKLLDSDLHKRFMKESYLNLKPASWESNDLKDFYLDILPILKEILVSKEHQVITLRQHRKSVIKRIELLLNPFILEDSKSIHSIKVIMEFISNIHQELQKECPKVEILLGFTHGDFWEGNILKNKKITKVIDWNTLGTRSSFFDFYFITFDKISKLKEPDFSLLTKEIEIAFKTFTNRYLEEDYVNARMAEEMVKQSDIYRQIFYLEFILQRLKENPLREQKYLEYLVNRINFFQKFERNKSELEHVDHLVGKVQ
ncbi:protein kinase family protein [Gottfriedia luciferensis]|uniref:hypothetical protein n=1 Tax=Gottfriedia luciferensis TaxID=178774 RepID=UPI000B43BFD0|nr:hypothetical protein [Gottfriedia luciferensis]